MGQITSLSPYVYDGTRSWAVGLTNEHLTVGENDPKACANEFERSTAIWKKRFTSAFRHRRVCTCIKNRLLAHYMCTVLQKNCEGGTRGTEIGLANEIAVKLCNFKIAWCHYMGINCVCTRVELRLSAVVQDVKFLSAT